MTEDEYQKIFGKIRREYPVRQKLAAILGRKPGEATIRDLFVDIQIFKPERVLEARELIEPLKAL